MEQGFEEQAYDAACMAIGDAVLQVVASGETVSHEAIAIMIIELSEQRPDLADSIALSVLLST